MAGFESGRFEPGGGMAGFASGSGSEPGGEMAGFEPRQPQILAHRLPVDAQFTRNPPVGPAMRRQSQYRMLQAHVEFVHRALVQPQAAQTQCVPQSGWFSFDPPWLVLTAR